MRPPEAAYVVAQNPCYDCKTRFTETEYAASNALYGFAKAMSMTGQRGPDGDE